MEFVSESRYFVGLDLGKRRDFSALALVEMMQTPGEFDRVWWVQKIEEVLALRRLERVPLGTSYPLVVERVRAVVKGLPRCTLVVDGTGVGAAVVDALRNANLGCEVVEVTITGGERSARVRGGYSVPRQDLVDNLRMMLGERRLVIAGGLTMRRALVEEFVNFDRRGNVHDDMVMAVALACWVAEVRGKTIGERGVRLL